MQHSTMNLQLVCRAETLSGAPQGYVEAAQVFEAESATAPGVDLGAITDRMEIRKAVQSGNMEEAIERVNDLNPQASGRTCDAQCAGNFSRGMGSLRSSKDVAGTGSASHGHDLTWDPSTGAQTRPFAAILNLTRT